MDTERIPRDGALVGALELLQIRHWNDLMREATRKFRGAASAAEERYQGRLSGGVKRSGGNHLLFERATRDKVNFESQSQRSG